MIDRHNQARQDTLGLEGKLETHEWAFRVNMTTFAMSAVGDTWLAFSQCTETQKSQKDLYTILAEELIDNGYDSVNVRGTRQNPGPPGMSPTLFQRASGDPIAARLLCPSHSYQEAEEERWCGWAHHMPFRGVAMFAGWMSPPTCVCCAPANIQTKKKHDGCVTPGKENCATPPHMTEYLLNDKIAMIIF